MPIDKPPADAILIPGIEGELPDCVRRVTLDVNDCDQVADVIEQTIIQTVFGALLNMHDADPTGEEFAAATTCAIAAIATTQSLHAIHQVTHMPQNDDTKKAIAHMLADFAEQHRTMITAGVRLNEIRNGDEAEAARATKQ